MIGFGFIGKVHCHAHLSLPLFYDPVPASTKLVGVCTATEAGGEKAIRQCGFQFSTTNYRELIARPDIDLIHICTPNNAHRDAIIEALRAGKHIYCDKPLALNLPDAIEICDIASSMNTVQQMTFNYRFVPAMLRAREIVESGFLGDLFQFRVAYLHAGYIDPARPYSWRTSFARSGGGAIADLGSHIIDLTRFLFGPGTQVGRGGEIDAVRAELQTVVKERLDPRTGRMETVDVDDIALVQCRLTGGAIGTLEASRMATGVQDELRVELHGSRGGLRFNLMDPNWLDAYDATTPETALGGDRGYRRIECVCRYPKPYAFGAVKNTVGWPSFHIQSLYDFVNNVALVRNGGAMSVRSPSFKDGLEAQRVIDACLRSSKSDRGWTHV